MIKIDEGDKSPFTGVLLTIDEADRIEFLIEKYEVFKSDFDSYISRNGWKPLYIMSCIYYIVAIL